MTMFRAVMAFFLLGLGQLSPAMASTLKPVLNTQEFASIAALPELRILDIRSPDLYAEGHIPNALSAPYGVWRGPADNPGKLADAEYLQTLVRDLGLDNDQHVVVYSSGDNVTDFGAAARVYWTLKYVGLTHLSLLDGGYQQWVLAGQPVSTEVATATASDYTVALDQTIVIDQQQLLEEVTQPSEGVQLLDARPQAFFLGKMKAPTASVPGTIKGAHNAEHQQWFNEESVTLKPSAEIVQLVQQQGLDQAQETVSFCNTGHWAATNWFVLSEVAGLKNVRLYPASLAEWTQSEVALPMDHTPSRGAQIRERVNSIFTKN